MIQMIRAFAMLVLATEVALGVWLAFGFVSCLVREKQSR